MPNCFLTACALKLVLCGTLMALDAPDKMEAGDERFEKLATVVAWFLARQDGRWHEHVPDMGLYCGLAGIVGARLWDVFFFDWAYYQDHLLEIPFVWQGGMAIQGGVLAGAIAGYLYTKRHGIDTWEFADIVAAPAVIIGQSIGRMANLLNGDAFGSHPFADPSGKG